MAPGSAMKVTARSIGTALKFVAPVATGIVPLIFTFGFIVAIARGTVSHGVAFEHVALFVPVGAT
jgi:hypothetical protein